jgi:hypothetical protein
MVSAFAWMSQGADLLGSPTVFTLLFASVSKVLPTSGWCGATYKRDAEVTQVYANRIGSWIVSQAEPVGWAGQQTDAGRLRGDHSS